MSPTRITTLGNSNAMLGYIMGTESDYYKLSEQASSGYKVSKPSDDPSAAKSILGINSKLDELKSYLNSMTTAQTELDTLDDTLSSLTDLIDKATDLATEASNGTYSNSDMDNIKTQVDQIIQSVLDLSNTEYDGKYIFSGNATLAQTYSVTKDTNGNITEITYEGTPSTSDYKRYVTISDGVSVSINTTGNAVFGSYSSSGGTSTGLFDTLVDLSNALGNHDQTAVSATLDGLNTSLNTVSAVRTKFASVSNRFEITENSINNTINNITSYKSDLENADLSEVLTELTMKQTALEATYNVFSSVNSMSLLNYI